MSSPTSPASTGPRSVPCRHLCRAAAKRWGVLCDPDPVFVRGRADCRLVWEDFLYVYQGGPQRAARAAAWARVRRSAGAPTPATQHARRLARIAGSPEGPSHDDSNVDRVRGWAGSRPGRAATSPRGVGERTPAAWASCGGCGVAVTAPPAGALRLQDGRGPVGGSRSVGGCSGPSRLPSTRASRADHRPTRQRPSGVKVRLTWRAGRWPAPRRAGRWPTGWRGGHAVRSEVRSQLR